MDSTSKDSRFCALFQFFKTEEAKTPPRISHPELEVYNSIGDENSLREAAVLIAITRPTAKIDSHIILTVRSSELKSHAGQISLPGGKSESIDADAVATALRESEEEIGLASSEVKVIGRLGTLALPSGYLVTPIVGSINQGIKFVRQAEEVAAIFQVPLNLVLDVQSYKKSKVDFRGKKRTILELQFQDYRIWGATAAILYNLAIQVSQDKRVVK
tara:strand:- start:1984 stop:2631 length:648 start_codon:yes stop_codon:yes gene_type:complete